MQRALAPITLLGDSRILTIRLASIGDAIIITPALCALRSAYPRAQIDHLTSDAPAAVLRHFHPLDEIIILDQPLKDMWSGESDFQVDNLDGLSPVLDYVRSKHYDAVLFLQHIRDYSRVLIFEYIAKVVGAKWNVGLDCTKWLNGQTNGHDAFLNVKVADGGYGACHEAEYYIAVAEAVGAVANDKRLYLPLSDEERSQAHEILHETPTSTISRPIIAMHPGSSPGESAKRWPAEKFAQLADIFHRDFGGQILLVGGPEEAFLRDKVIRSMRSCTPCRSLSGKESITLTAAIIEQCDVFVGNDSGLMHIAAAVDTPTVAIFGLTNHKAWGPYTPATPQRSMVVRQTLSCMPCCYRDYEPRNTDGCATRDCLRQLPVAAVANAVRTMLRENFSIQE